MVKLNFIKSKYKKERLSPEFMIFAKFYKLLDYLFNLKSKSSNVMIHYYFETKCSSYINTLSCNSNEV